MSHMSVGVKDISGSWSVAACHFRFEAAAPNEKTETAHLFRQVLYSLLSVKFWLTLQMRARVRTHTNTRMHTHAHAREHTRMYTHTHTRARAHADRHTHAIDARVFVCVFCIWCRHWYLFFSLSIFFFFFWCVQWFLCKWSVAVARQRYWRRPIAVFAVRQNHSHHDNSSWYSDGDSLRALTSVRRTYDASLPMHLHAHYFSGNWKSLSLSPVFSISLSFSFLSISLPLLLSPTPQEKKKKKKRKKKKKKEFDPLHFAYRANRSVDDVVALGFHYILQALGLSKYMCKSFVDTDIIPQNYVNSWWC